MFVYLRRGCRERVRQVAAEGVRDAVQQPHALAAHTLLVLVVLELVLLVLFHQLPVRVGAPLASHHRRRRPELRT